MARNWYPTEADLARIVTQPGYRIVGEPSPSTEGMPEGAFLAQVRRCALDNGFLFYHTFDSRRSESGYLDCTLAKPGHPLYIWELKSTHGKVTREQAQWVAFLSQTTGIEVGVYRPEQWPLLEACLRRGGGIPGH